VNCETAREAISALLDSEPPGVDLSELERHLGGCPDCVRWRDGAHTVTRRARIALARSAPAVSESLLAAVGGAAPSWRPSTITRARLGLVAVALVQIVVTIPPLILGSDHSAPMHVAHEMGAFDMALAIGFLAAAWRPSYASGMHVLVGAAALLLVVTAVIDMIAARTTPGAEAPHLLAVAGWMLLRIVAGQTPSREASHAATPIEIVRRRRRAGALHAAGSTGLSLELRAEPAGEQPLVPDVAKRAASG
jgi:predicted anti-sigma-YlaC factor YlaD